MSGRNYLPLENLKKRALRRVGLTVPVNKTTPTHQLPHVVSLNEYRKFPAYDQGSIGSCTANAWCAAYRILDTINNKNPTFVPSRLFFYYQERVIEGTVNEDSGADVVDGESYVKANGVCSEETWPYDISKLETVPSPESYTEAAQYKISAYQVLPTGPQVVDEIKHAIFNKNPVLIAVAIYDSFESPETIKTGKVPIPNTTKESLLGGHEMCLLGYNDTTHHFTVLNSWGTNVGDSGLFYIPYEYLANPNLGMEFTVFEL